MSTNGVGRIKHWSSPDILYQGVPTGTEEYEDVARVWDQRTGTVAAFRDPPPPPPGITLQVLISGPFELGWHASGVLSASAFLDDPEDENGGPCTNCTYLWYERSPGGTWYNTGITTTSYYATMLWTEGRDYRVDVTDGSMQAMDTHFVDYCASPCGPPAKRDETDISKDAIVGLYPNPSVSGVTIRFIASSEAEVEIRVVDLLGRIVRRVPVAAGREGENEVEVDMAGASSGVYHVLLVTEETVTGRTLIHM